MERFLRREALTGDTGSLVLLLVASVALGVATLLAGAGAVPAAAQVLPLGAAALRLRLISLRWLVGVTAVMLAVDIVGLGASSVRLGTVVVVAIVAVAALELARGREGLGLSGPRSESMLTELGQRLQAQGRLPRLPPGWDAEVVLRPAGGGAFAGDFLVSAEVGGQLEIALVDVSGKGVDAGTRALLLSGALGGLLGSVPSADFLSAANCYLVRQDWEEGFATAVHVAIDLDSGHYRVHNAGHPPLAQFDAGSGGWRLAKAEGPALGLLDAVTYPATTGTLRRGDAVLLYTDGLVEVPGRDLTYGIDKLLGEAERLVPRGFAGGAVSLVDAVAPHSSDDRALLLLWRHG